MATEVATAIAYVGAFAGLIGGSVALFNSWMSVSWKRAELANTYLKDFNNNAELVFAGRCLDWNGGKLALPENLRPYMPNEERFIVHDRALFEKSLGVELTVSEMNSDPRIQIYRTSIDSFLSWISLVSGAIERNLFGVADIEDVAYWIAKIESDEALHPFIIGYGYQNAVQKLAHRCRREKSNYRWWRFPASGHPSP